MNKSKKMKITGNIIFSLSITLYIASAIIGFVSPIASLLCFGFAFGSMNLGFCLKQYSQSLEVKKEPTFDPFPDPNGIPYEEYKQMETTNNIQHNETKYNKLKVTKTYIKNRYNNTSELQK